MRVQQVTVDVWKMLVTAASYLALAFAAWILLRLVCACITLPGYLKKQQQEEDAEEERLLRALHEEGDLEDEDEDDDDEEEDDEEQDDGPPGGDKGAPILTPPTPRANRVRRRVTKSAGQGAADKATELEQLLPSAGELLDSCLEQTASSSSSSTRGNAGEKKKRR